MVRKRSVSLGTVVQGQRHHVLHRCHGRVASAEAVMTTPAERTKAVLGTRDFLEILSRADEVTIHGLVQSVAASLLRHYPLEVDLHISAAALPTVWAPPSTPGGKGEQVAREFNLAHQTWTVKK
ncbi:BPSL0761 family protein [Paraburkholderia phenoliruptrix]|uniref:BPSL0761 family protein n=1 Tax=Paraburkholderia phenoliruptrix TaxID=252970 RepID=UPI0032084328